MLKKFALALVISGALTPAWADALQVGDKLSQFSLSDQHEIEQSLDEGVRTLLFSRDMAGGDIIQQVLESMTPPLPEDLRYVADISGMPGLIAKFVAIPQLQQLPFSIVLDRDGALTASLPAQEDKATLIQLRGMTVEAVHYFDSVESLQQHLAE
ncbi:periplasmic protein [Shewanella sp. NFH-SH190041]|uniref:hypothetical protein n=1 Tax=Shewanella sp. NFH-SH190041 TaxID=2950245 RepID=UPI0021C3F717|nr:hypothetical protein [Shewanella sp. NFH-SH190041]BDM63035.1 periplasmic protein [Shewanella sp. NFH-SH190041]